MDPIQPNVEDLSASFPVARVAICAVLWYTKDGRDPDAQEGEDVTRDKLAKRGCDKAFTEWLMQNYDSEQPEIGNDVSSKFCSQAIGFELLAMLEYERDSDQEASVKSCFEEARRTASKYGLSMDDARAFAKFLIELLIEHHTQSDKDKDS